MSETTTNSFDNVSTTEELSQADIINALDSMWILIAGFLVFFMQAGFAMLETGAVRSINAQNILLKNLFDIAVGSILWWLLGYGFAYGNDGGNGFIGNSQFAGSSDDFLARDWFFQWAFAATAATIVSGALAGRTQFLAYSAFSIFITGFIYPVVVHWTWGGGWLANNGYQDFAGSGIVHMLGGVCALVGAFMVGPRNGMFVEETNVGCCSFKRDLDKVESFRASNMPLVVMGTLILWFGWYGFNCGSTLGFVGSNVDAAGTVALNTSIAAGVAGITVMLFSMALQKCYNINPQAWDVAATSNGILAGLVSITAGCADVTDYGAFIIGIIGGLIYVGTSKAVKKTGIDDPLDAFAIHGACGAWGVFALGLFSTSQGAFYGFGGNLLGWQIIGILCISAWALALSFFMFGVLSACKALRASNEDQETGLDEAHHGGAAYAFQKKLEMVELGESSESKRNGDINLSVKEQIKTDTK